MSMYRSILPKERLMLPFYIAFGISGTAVLLIGHWVDIRMRRSRRRRPTP